MKTLDCPAMPDGSALRSRRHVLLSSLSLHVWLQGTSPRPMAAGLPVCAAGRGAGGGSWGVGGDGDSCEVVLWGSRCWVGWGFSG